MAKAVAAPLAVAFSGGGDSLALLIAAKAWADGASRRLVALTVDHGLQAASAEWARWCRRRADELGAEHRTLPWPSSEPRGNLAARAREARHQLLADAARNLGARVILLGHTLDDLLESRLMRAAGSWVGEAAPWSPSPVWPQGRSIFLLRPLIGFRRAELRSFLAAAGETWLEDPANDDPRSARARARSAIEAGARACGRASRAAPGEPARRLLEVARIGPGGEIAVPRSALGAAVPHAARAFVGASLLCAAGASHPPAGRRLDRLMRRLDAPGGFTATLAGARIEAGEAMIAIMREPGDLARRGGGRIIGGVWDGRFEMEPGAPAGSIRQLDGLARLLTPPQRRALRGLPPAARRALPVIVLTNGKGVCPILASEEHSTARSLVPARLAAALGLIRNEAESWEITCDMAQAGRAS
ncbi:MAG: tRNA lysidine(34) synthetase TilS [Caulobacteraceae bacterium]